MKSESQHRADREAPLVAAGDLAAAIGLLTRLPVPAHGARGGAAAWAYPLVGAGIGALTGGILSAAAATDLPPPVAAGLAVAVAVTVTGALHEDGLADAADGLWGGWTRERRLEIMRDSRIGAYGVLALVLSLLLRWSCFAAIAPTAGAWLYLAAAGAASRAAMVALWSALPPARRDGLAAGQGRPRRATALLAGVLALAVLATLPAGGGVPVALACAGAALVCGRLAWTRIGGQTGDVLGATQQVCEIAALLAATAFLA